VGKDARRKKVRSNRLKVNKQDRMPLLIPLLRRMLTITASVLLFVMVASSLFIAGRVLLASDYFAVENIRCEGAQRVAVDDIIAASEIVSGDKMFSLDIERIGENISAHVWIAEADVRREFPRDIVITIRERQPLAIISLDYLYYIDAAGVIFKVLGQTDSFDYPVITGFSRSDFDAEEGADRLMDRLKRVCKLLVELKNRKTFAQDDISELHVAETGEINLYTLQGGVPVRIGDKGFCEKLDRFEKIYGELKTRLGAIRSIDLNVENRVIVRLDSRYTKKS